MYEIVQSRGQGLVRGPRFRLLDDALRYVATHAGEASFAIRAPDGTWYRRDQAGRLVFARARRTRSR